MKTPVTAIFPKRHINTQVVGKTVNIDGKYVLLAVFWL